MRAFAQKLWMAARRLAGASEGVAAVEFALILPVMLLVYLGTMEASALISMDRRVQTVAESLGDLVARANRQISTVEITNYFHAADGVMQPFTPTDLKQVVTSVYVKTDGTTEIKWSKPYNGGTAHTVGAAYALPSAITNISRNAYVIVSEASYSYRPLRGLVYKEAIPLYREAFYVPRFGEEIKLN
jgi:Flp pilus assembly protein TadG